jgi:type I restriction enzyme S subunit
VKAGWTTATVGEIADHSLGKMLDKAKNRGEPQPYLRNQNVRWFDFDLSDVHEMRFLPQEEARYTAVEGDVLICEGGYPGRAAIWDKDEPIYFQKAVHRVRFHEPKRARWFLYYLYAKDLDGTLRSHFTGTGIQHFTREALAQLDIPLPPLVQQELIVELLDQAFDGSATITANSEKNIHNARSLFDSCLGSVFTERGQRWQSAVLGDVCERVTVGHVGTTSPHYRDKGITFLRTQNVGERGLILDDVKYVTPEFHAALRKSEVRPNDVLMSRVISSSVRCALVPSNLGPANCANVVLVRPGATLLPKYLVHYIRSRQAQRHLLDRKVGSAQLVVNTTVVKNWPILLPPLAEQEHIVAKLDALAEETQHLQSLYEQKVAAVDALKASLLHQAFSGELGTHAA